MFSRGQTSVDLSQRACGGDSDTRTAGHSRASPFDQREPPTGRTGSVSFGRGIRTIGEKCRFGCLHQAAAMKFSDHRLNDFADLFRVETVRAATRGAAADRLIREAVLGQETL